VPPDPGRCWAAWPALAGLAFVALWNLDLGWPADLDLAAIPLLPMSLVLADAVLDRGPRGPWARTAMAAAALLYGGLVTALVAR
jgi:hypothetical protein